MGKNFGLLATILQISNLAETVKSSTYPRTATRTAQNAYSDQSDYGSRHPNANLLTPIELYLEANGGSNLDSLQRQKILSQILSEAQ